MLAPPYYILALIPEVSMEVSMIRKLIAVVPLFAILSWGAGTQQDAKTVISSATKALGADNLKTVEFSGSGFDYVVGQAPNPSSPWPKFNDKTYNRVVD